MPYRIETNNPECLNGYAVVKESDGTLLACHSSRREAKAQIVAIELSENYRLYRITIVRLLRKTYRTGEDALIALITPAVTARYGTLKLWLLIIVINGQARLVNERSLIHRLKRCAKKLVAAWSGVGSTVAAERR
jgi:hypothetical protein